MRDFGLRDADHLQQLDRALRRGLLVHLQVQLERLGDLAPDRQHRVERRHRLLEDHRDLVAADVPDLVLVHLEEVFALEEDLAADDLARRVRDQPQDRERADALAAAALADEAERLARLDVVGDAVDGLDDALFREEVRPQVLDLQERFAIARSSFEPRLPCALRAMLASCAPRARWWGRGDSNSYALRHVILNHARLPIPTLPLAWPQVVGRPGLEPATR